ncbi:MAG: 50S ribosomal protein L15 [Spirochaetaceae bacterium]|jgi:large subunit ribosomal protein L15|nr:50S ribosomal protein L15 [Spirochaetaceae bacterium]
MHSFDLRRPDGANKRKRIVGRGQGSGRGTTAGKGNKGQQSRSGGKTYVGFEGGQMPLYRRLAHRGFSNYPFKKTFQVVNLSQIEKHFESGDTVDLPSLFLKGLVKGSDPVKILGDGALTKKIDLKIAYASASAKEKIRKAGGVVAELAKSTEESTGKKA